MESNFKNDANEIVYKAEADLTNMEKKYGYQRVNLGWGINQVLGMNMQTRLWRDNQEGHAD